MFDLPLPALDAVVRALTIAPPSASWPLAGGVASTPPRPRAVPSSRHACLSQASPPRTLLIARCGRRPAAAR